MRGRQGGTARDGSISPKLLPGRNSDTTEAVPLVGSSLTRLPAASRRSNILMQSPDAPERPWGRFRRQERSATGADGDRSGSQRQAPRPDPILRARPTRFDGTWWRAPGRIGCSARAVAADRSSSPGQPETAAAGGCGSLSSHLRAHRSVPTDQCLQDQGLPDQANGSSSLRACPAATAATGPIPAAQARGRCHRCAPTPGGSRSTARRLVERRRAAPHRAAS